MNLSGQSGVGINTSLPQSSLDVNGSFGGKISVITVNTNLDTGYFIIICNNSSNITLSLPPASSAKGRIYFIKRINTGVVTIIPNANDSIDDTTAWVQLTKYQLTSVICQGNNKWIVANDVIPKSGGILGAGLTNADKKNVTSQTPAVTLSNNIGAVLDSLKINIDTANGINAGLLTPFEKLRIISLYDSILAFQIRIEARVKYTDTATMLNPYLRKADTSGLVRSSSNGITKTGGNVQLGGSLNQATTITTTVHNTLAIAGLTSSSSSDSILMINPSTNVITIKENTFVTNSLLTATTQAVTNITLATVNTLQFSYEANKRYRVKAYLLYNSSATNESIRLSIPAITGNIWSTMTVPSTTTTSQFASRFNSSVVFISTSSAATTNNMAVIELTLWPTANGTFSFQFAAESSGGTITILGNSLLEYTQIN